MSLRAKVPIPAFRICLSSLLSTTYCHFSCYGLSPLARPYSTGEKEVFASNVKIGALSRAGKIELARQLFDTMPMKDVVTWNAIVTGYWQNGLLDESMALFNLMPLKNVVSWNSMISGCVEHERVEEAFRYFQTMPERNTASWNAMISGFVRFGRVEEASTLFAEMPCRNVISYTAMIDGYAKKGELERARALFDCMPDKNVVSWTVMIIGYVEHGRFDDARKLYEQMPRKTIMATTVMITCYCKEGRIGSARILFDQIQCKDLVSWNAMITGYAQNGSGEEALDLLARMLQIGMLPDDLTLVPVFTACSALASLQEGRQNHVLVIKNGFESYVCVCNALITMYSKCGGIHDSELAFSRIHSPDIVSWNTFISALAQHGLYDKAVAFFHQMKLKGIEPDGVTFLGLFSACDHAGKVNESMSFFDSMVNGYGICPGYEHYTCLVNILSRAGELAKANKIIQEMPYEADSHVWGALLAACCVYSNVELGEIAAKKIRDLDPQSSGAYVMLSNLYAASGKWRDVNRVRILMKEQGVKKQRAYSWMEISNKVHLFLGGDVSHSDIDAIHLVLKKISLHIKAINHNAKTDPV